MADIKISALPSATTPLAGTEVLPIVQTGVTAQVSVSNLTAGRAVSASGLTVTGTTSLATTNLTNLLTQSTGANVASSATLNLSAATGNMPRITGTTATSAVTMNAGQWAMTIADGAWPLTYNATTNKINSGGLNITLAANDRVLYHKDLSGVVHGEIIKANGTPVVSGLYLSVKTYGATGDGVTDDSVAVQATITAAIAAGGGTVFFPVGVYLCNTALTCVGNYVNFLGASRGASAITTTSTTNVLLKITGTGCGISNMIIYRNVFTSSTTAYTVQLLDAVQTNITSCWFQGGFHCLAITGTSCSDSTIIDTKFTFATGSAQVLLQSATGINGSHHFYRCTMNQAYPVATPTSVKYRGARGNLTVYAAQDIITSGGYYWQCSVGGTSAASTPAGLTTPTAFYGVGVVDGSVTFLLMGSTGFTGVTFDTNISYSVLQECDLTGVYTNAINITDTLSGANPYAITIKDCTAHGPIFNGVNIASGTEHLVRGMNTWNPTGGGTTYGIIATCDDDVIITESSCYGFSNGIYVGTYRATVTSNHVYGNTAGIRVAAGFTGFNIVSNSVGTSSTRGANTTGIIVDVGASDYYTITNNSTFGAGTGVTDGGTGTNKTVAANH